MRHDVPVIVRITEARVALLERAVGQFKGAQGAASFVHAPGTVAFVAVDDGEVLGWCFGYELPRPDADTMFYLHELEVAPDHRRLGIGRALLAAFLAASTAAGASKLFLTTETANQPARSLYESLGGRLAAGGETVNYWFGL